MNSDHEGAAFTASHHSKDNENQLDPHMGCFSYLYSYLQLSFHCWNKSYYFLQLPIILQSSELRRCILVRTTNDCEEHPTFAFEAGIFDALKLQTFYITPLLCDYLLQMPPTSNFGILSKESRSQWQSGLKHELSSLVRTLGSWVWIPLEAWMSVCVYSVCR
jgi:hypothetical protein